MGDMGEALNALKDYRKQERKKRLESANPDGWSQHTEHHWYRIIDGRKINYWPSSGLVMIGKKRFNINSKKIQSLIGQEDNQ